MLPLLLLAGATMASSAIQQTSAKKEALRQSTEDNLGIVEQNIQGQARSAARIGLTRLGLAYQQRQLAMQNMDAREAGLRASSEAEANSAATGAIGASADAVRTDVDREVGNFVQAQRDQLNITNLNYNTQVEAISQEARARIVHPRKLNVPSDWEILGQSALQGAVAAGTQYVSSQLSLGLGPGKTGGK